MAATRSIEFETCVPPPSLIRSLRELSSDAGWEMKRSEGARMVDRWAVIIPLAQNARTLTLTITSGPLAGLELHTWSHTRASAGAIHHAVFTWGVRLVKDDIRLLIQHWCANLPRCPFRWTTGERMVIGFLLPVFRRSRRSFMGSGIPTGKGEWPQQLFPEWPPAHLLGEEE